MTEVFSEKPSLKTVGEESSLRKPALPLNQIVCGDCLEVMKTLPDESVDLTIADPPYSSGARQTNQMRVRDGMNRANKWQGQWFGTDNLSSYGFMFFLRGLALSLFQKSKMGAHFYCFIDWRNYPLLFGSVESAGWRVNNLLVWDKQIFGMGDNYRNQHELIIFASKGKPHECNRKDVSNILRVKRITVEEHPTEKPIELIEKMVGMSSSVGDFVVDPFIGSGTTAVVCARLRRNYFGIDISPEYCEIAQKRLSNVPERLEVFSPNV